MLLPNRNGSAGSYRYGFQGQEKDDEIKGEGNSINYKYRMHDPRVGRFFAVDPLTHKYPHYTPYSFSGNKVIQFIELEGAEEFTNLSLADKNKGYNILFVVPECRDKVIEADYQMALDNDIPIMQVRNFDEFAKGVKQLNKSGITISTVATTAHGHAEFTYIGDTGIVNEGYSIVTDGINPSENPSSFPNLNDQLEAKYLVMLSCLTGVDGGGFLDGEKLTEGIAKSANVKTITALHLVPAGVEFDGGETFNNGGIITWEGLAPEFNRDSDYNLYLMIDPEGNKEVIENLKLDTDKQSPIYSKTEKKGNEDTKSKTDSKKGKS